MRDLNIRTSPRCHDSENEKSVFQNDTPGKFWEKQNLAKRSTFIYKYLKF